MNTSKLNFRFSAFALKFRWLILVVTLGITTFFAMQIPKIDIKNDPDTLLPQSNRYVATNNFVESFFGMANLCVVSVEPKEGSVYQPWVVNMTQQIHNEMASLPAAANANFISIAAQKVKNMGVTEDGSLSFKRLIPLEGISTPETETMNTFDYSEGQKQLDFMKEGLDNNPVLKPMVLLERDPITGEKCEPTRTDCDAKATFIIADFTNDVKGMYVPWVREFVKRVDKYADDPRVNISIAGEPYFLAWMMVQLIDHWYLFVASILIAFIILLAETKTLKGAIFPLMGVGMSIIWTLGIMGWSGFTLTTMMVLTPMLILAVGMGHAIQITRRYMKARRDGENVRNGAYVALGFVIVPATLSIVTDAIGFATLASVDISFYKAYAYFGMFGMFSLLITTTTLIPILMSIFDKQKEGEKLPSGYAWEGKMASVVGGLTRGVGVIIPFGIVIAIIMTSIHYTKIDEGIANIAADERPLVEKLKLATTTDELDLMPGVEKGIDYAQAAFKNYSRPVQDIFHLNTLMPGVISFSIPIRGKQPLLPECDDAYYDAYYDAEDNGTPYPAKNCYDPENDAPQGIVNDAQVMKALSTMENELRKNEHIGFTASYAQYLKIANLLLMSEGNKLNFGNFIIPDKEFLTRNDAQDDRDPSEIVSTYNGLLDMASAPGDLASMTGQDYNTAVVLGFINTMNPKETHEAVLAIQSYIEEHKNDPGLDKVYFGFRNADTSGDTEPNISNDKLDTYLEPGIGGFLGATEATREVTYENWIMNPLGTALAIFIVASLIFRSFLVSGFLMTILGITLFAQYGMAGYFSSVENWSANLHFGNLVTLSIAMGLGVDYSIYMISQLKEEYAARGNWKESVHETIKSTGSSVVISVVVLIGAFIPLLGTTLANTWGLSIYIIEAIIIDVITSLTLLPILLYIFKPKYVFGSKK